MEEEKVIYCSKCGTKNDDSSNYCSKCGAPLHEVKFEDETPNSQVETKSYRNDYQYSSNTSNVKHYSSSNNTMVLIAFVFEIIEIVGVTIGFLLYLILAITSQEPALFVIAIIFLLPLAWGIPLTIKTYKYYKNEADMGVGIKVVILLLMSFISGILLLCDGNN